MNFTELAKQRFSVRSFKPDALDEKQLDEILEAGRLAPTAKNFQPYHIYVIQSEEARSTINEITACAYHAPVVLMICADLDQGWVNDCNGHSAAEMDCSIVTTHMMLKAAELGVGSCWVCLFDPAKAKSAFQLPDNYEVCCLLPLGYPADNAAPSERHTLRKSKQEVTTVL